MHNNKKLFLVHCGFYDKEILEGIYESHVNFFVVAEDLQQARSKAKEHPEFKRKRMHIDGMQQLDAIDGFRITVERDESLSEPTSIQNYSYRELSNKPIPTA